MRQSIAACMLVLFAGVGSSALAVEKEPFSEARFAALQTAGEVVLIDVFASWCSTCAKQQEILTKYREENPDKRFYILEVDFDRDKNWVRQFRAPRQATLLLYSGQDQFWYSVAETRSDVIVAELDKAIAAAAANAR
jgi:thioredoxin 1